MLRTTSCLLSTAALAAATLVLAPPSQAAGHTVSTIEELQARLADCQDGEVLDDLDDIVAEDEQLEIGCSVTLDLDNARIRVRNIVIGAGHVLTITDSSRGTDTDGGTVTADASDVDVVGDSVAGLQNTGATVVVSGRAHLVAFGGSGAAGIGGGSRDGDAGSGGTTIARQDAYVSAHGGDGAAGIGGGFGGYGGGEGGVTEAHDSSAIVSIGGDGGAGIGGGGYYGNGGTTTATGTSSISAVGGVGGAGIGGGAFGGGGTTAVHDAAEIEAEGEGYGAGVGGGQMGGGGTTTVTGSSTLLATGGEAAAGIGGGGGFDDNTGPYGGGPGGTTRVIGGTVTASGGETAIGAGAYYQSGGGFGSLEVSTNAVLRLPEGRLQVRESGDGPEVVVRSGGRITGAGQIAGDGQVANHGAILLPAGHVYPTTVTDHAYRVTFDARGGKPRARTRYVYAASFAQAGLAFPKDPTVRDGVFVGWNRRPRGTGSQLTVSTRLVRVNGTTCPGLVPVTAYAQYLDGPEQGASRAGSSPQHGCVG